MTPPANKASVTSSAATSSSSPDSDAASARFWNLAGLLALLLGVVVRLAEYLSSRSLWADEARLAVNIVEKDYVRLAGRLDENQAAPCGFLFATKWLAASLGSSENVLRLIPFVAGVLVLPMVWLAGRELLGKRGAVIALSFVAVSEPLIYFSNELKQYSVDALVSVLLVWLGVRADRGGGRMNWLLLGVVGCMALPMSHTAVFVCAGVGLALIWGAWSRSGLRGAVGPAVVVLAWAGMFFVLYMAVIRHASDNTYLRAFWDGAFPGVDPVWYIDVAMALFADPVGLTSAGLAAACAVVGAVGLWRAKRVDLAILALPVVGVLAAAALRIYPIRLPITFAYPPAGRLVLFIAPLLALLVAAGVEGLRQQGDKLARSFAVLAWVLLVGQPFSRAIARTVNPPERQELRQLLNTVAEHARSDDGVLLYFQAGPAYRFYLPRTKARNSLIATPYLLPSRGDWTLYEDDVAAVARPGRRVWVIYVDHPDWTAKSELNAVLLICSRYSTPVTHITAPGATAILLEFFVGKAGP